MLQQHRSELGRKAKAAYWRVVADLLVEVFEFKKGEAKTKTAMVKNQIDPVPRGNDSDIFYHQEPFDVALEIARSRVEVDGAESKSLPSLDDPKISALYERILSEHERS